MSEADPLYRIAQLERLLQNIVVIASITETDFQNLKVRCVAGDLDFGWLDWPCEVGKNFKAWRPLRVGTQVIVTSPGGDTTQGKITSMLYTDALAAPSTDEDVDLIQFNDGAKVEYNSKSGDMTVWAVGNMIHKANKLMIYEAKGHRFYGPVEQTGGDMTSDGVSAQKHVHEKTKSDPFSKSGKPDK